MTLSDAEEILPLLDHNKRAETEVQYQSVFDSNQNKHRTLPTLGNNVDLADESVIGITDSIADESLHRNRRLLSTHRITYTWKNVYVYESPKLGKRFWHWEEGLTSLKKRFSVTSKPILRNVYGIAYPGELLAIMGSSGAGKTTLLNALTFQSGSTTIVKGERHLKGYPLTNRKVVARLSAYVEQDNMFLGNLTVKEHLIFQALVRMDSGIPYKEKIKRVEEVMTELGLENCKNTAIGCPGRSKGISGGEMKRLSFASEILTNPPLLFCDEPTSGLDSFIALNVVSALKFLAKKGKTVVCTIHQPSSEIFTLFDKILLLAEGRTAFLGNLSDATRFFTDLGAAPLPNYNPADFYIQLLAVVPHREENSRETIKFICDSFDQSSFALKLIDKIEFDTEEKKADVRNECGRTLFAEYQERRKYRATWCSQFRALFWRSWLNISKEPLVIKMRFFQTIVISLVVGLIFHQQKLNEDGVMNINGVLFTFLTNMTFQNLFAVICVFCAELPIFMKEHSNKLYGVDVYFLSKTLAEFPMFLIMPTIFTAITYFWINLNPGLNHFGATLLILVLVTNVATSFGYFISCISTSAVMALSVGPPVIIPFLLFGGFLLNVGTIPTYFRWLSYLSWFKYGNEALLINQWSDIDAIECNKSNVTCPKNGEIILEIFHFQKDNFIWDLAGLTVQILLFRFTAYLALVFKALRYQQRLCLNG